MKYSPFDHMQAAVDIVQDSPHLANKIAATIAGEGFAVSKTNHWPAVIEEKIGREGRIGNSSGTLHAETACLIEAPVTEGASLFVTDPPCPNCVKYMAEAGIKAIYIDHKGFDKDFARRRGEAFENMSMRICERAGIDVFEIWRKEEKILPIFTTPENYEPAVENPIIIEACEIMDEAEFVAHAKSMEAQMSNTSYAVVIARDTEKTFIIAAQTHPIIGYTSATMENEDGKYSFLVQPVTRVMMAARRQGLSIDPDYVFSSIVPTARQLVNMVGAGLTRIHIGHPEKSRDEFGPVALKQLVEVGILNIQH